MTDEAPTDLLSELSNRMDLTEYQIEAYVAVLQYGELTATQIAERTSVPQPRVYDTVRELHDRGLVDMQESRPMRVLAIEPHEAFRHIQDELKTTIGELSSIYTQPNQGVEASMLVQSRSTILRHLYKVISAADYELIASLPVPVFESVTDQLKDLYSRGVRIDLVLTPSAEVPLAGEFDYSNVAHSVRRRRGVGTPAIVSADGSFSLFTSHEAITTNGGAGKNQYGVIFNRNRLGFLATGFLDAIIWSTSEPVFESERTLPFPRKYATIRRASNDIRRLTGDFQAKISGRYVETGEQVILEGQVLDIESDANRTTSALVVDTDEGEITVGGQMAAYEDVEAMEIEISRL